MTTEASIARHSAITLLIVFLSGCVSFIESESSYSDIQPLASTWARALQSSNPSLPFNREGPYSYREIENHDFQLGLENFVKVNLAIPNSVKNSPVVIIQHGNMSFKEAHQDQMRWLASWGFTVITPQLKNFGEWVQNGARLKSMVQIIAQWPSIISDSINPSKIILAGHSFGGSAVSLAAAKGAKASGLILLDPALYSNTVWKSLPKVNAPTFVLAADPAMFKARRRQDFFARIPENITELVIAGSTHDDAQMPSLNSLRFFGFDPTTSRDRQQRFLNSLTMAAIAIAEPNLNSRVWQYFKQGLRTGYFVEAKRK